MNFNLVVWFIFSLTNWTYLAGQSDYDHSLIKALKMYRTAFLDQDLESLSNYAHPNVLNMGGGAMYYKRELVKDMEMFREADLEITDLIFSQHSVVIRVNEDLQAMVPYRLKFLSGDNQLTERHFYLATSQDNGKNWNFTDMKKYDPKKSINRPIYSS